jgi:hypothetical protein
MMSVVGLGYLPKKDPASCPPVALWKLFITLPVERQYWQLIQAGL